MIFIITVSYGPPYCNVVTIVRRTYILKIYMVPLWLNFGISWFTGIWPKQNP